LQKAAPKLSAASLRRSWAFVFQWQPMAKREVKSILTGNKYEAKPLLKKTPFSREAGRLGQAANSQDGRRTRLHEPQKNAPFIGGSKAKHGI